jgi:hypothetical protein
LPEKTGVSESASATPGITPINHARPGRGARTSFPPPCGEGTLENSNFSGVQWSLVVSSGLPTFGNLHGLVFGPGSHGFLHRFCLISAPCFARFSPAVAAMSAFCPSPLRCPARKDLLKNVKSGKEKVNFWFSTPRALPKAGLKKSQKVPKGIKKTHSVAQKPTTYRFSGAPSSNRSDFGQFRSENPCARLGNGVERCQKMPSTLPKKYDHTDFIPILDRFWTDFPACRALDGPILDCNSCARAQNLGQKRPSSLPKVRITDVRSSCFRREAALGMFENLSFRLKPKLPTWNSTTLERPWRRANARKNCLSPRKISVF